MSPTKSALRLRIISNSFRNESPATGTWSNLRKAARWRDARPDLHLDFGSVEMSDDIRVHSLESSLMACPSSIISLHTD